MLSRPNKRIHPHRPLPVIVIDGVYYDRTDALTPPVRWRARQKELICRAIMLGIVSLREIMEAHRMSRAEVVELLIRFQEHGPDGLQEKRIQSQRRDIK